MRIPDAFTLAGNRWRVRLVPKKKLRQDDGTYAMGECVPASKQILIDKKLNQPLRIQTFIHECVHAILFTMGHIDGHDEVAIEATAQMVYQLLITQEFITDE